VSRRRAVRPRRADARGGRRPSARGGRAGWPLLVVLSLLGVPGPAGATGPGPPSAPLATSFATPAGSWAVVAMGHLDDPLNTFWQLFFRPDGATNWDLRTPPGVADNGGLVTTGASAGDLTVAFLPSEMLGFSPSAATADDGASWSPGVIPLAVAPLPDALGGAPDGVVWAVVRGGAGARVAGQVGPAGRWRTVTTGSALAATPAGRSCGLVAVTSVSVGAVGGSCTRSGVVGIFERAAGRWRLTGPWIGAGAGATTVLRLDLVDGAETALVAARRGGSTSLVALRAVVGADRWAVSAPLALGRTGRLCSSGTDPAGGVVVVTGATGQACRSAAASTGGGQWRRLPVLPPGTAVVSGGAGGLFDALSVHSTLFTDWRLRATRWVGVQSLRVPIQFGSSN